MQVYICQHCFAILGPVVYGEAVPHCTDHPAGAVMVSTDEEAHDASLDS